MDSSFIKRTLSASLFLTGLVWAVVAFYFGWPYATGLALGSSQAVSRTMMSRLTPPQRLAEFFGLYGVATKFSAAIGPVVFGLVSSLGNQRLAILAVGAFFVVGAVILLTVDEPAGIRAARAPEPDN